MDEDSVAENLNYEENIRRGRRLIIALILGLIGLVMIWTIAQMTGQADAAVVSTDQLEPQSFPAQTSLLSPEQAPIEVGSFFAYWVATPRARYRIDARVVSTHPYFLDLYARFSPVDFALAWGVMFDPQVDAWVTWDQRNRWYYYHNPEDSPYSLSEIRDHSANVHIIPATESLENALLTVETGDVIRLEGRLVDVYVNLLGFEFETPTSLSRQDSGAGACEVLYVERLVLDGIEYR